MVHMSNTITDWLRAGDLRTDGAADEVAALVTADPDLLADLIDALRSPDDPTRGRAADALEKVARTHGEAVLRYLDLVIELGCRDPVPMVRWHVAMILGYLSPQEEEEERVRDALLNLLHDPSAFVRSWAVVSLCLLARRRPDWGEDILRALQPLELDESKAVRTRIAKALPCLLQQDADLPAGWDKSRGQQKP